MVSEKNTPTGRLPEALAHASTRFGALRVLIWYRSEAFCHYANTGVLWQSFGRARETSVAETMETGMGTVSERVVGTAGDGLAGHRFSARRG
jgi:hypothetical protein